MTEFDPQERLPVLKSNNFIKESSLSTESNLKSKNDEEYNSCIASYIIVLCTVNSLYNDIRYKSKIRYNVNLVCTKISGLCIFY